MSDHMFHSCKQETEFIYNTQNAIREKIMASLEERAVSTEGNGAQCADSNLSVVVRHGDHERKEKRWYLLHGSTVWYSQPIELPPELMEKFDAGELLAAS